MKRLFLVSIMLIFSIGVWAQTITLSFTGQDAANHHVQLERVIITNLSQNWQETLYWPDTTLTLNNGVGINDNEDPVGFKLYQNNPNPFNGITDASLTVVDAGSVALEITDVNGRAIENRIYASLPAGTHHYRVTLSAAGTYIMTARQNGKTSSIKMINNGSGGGNSIMQLEHVVGEIIAKSGDGTKSNVTHPWAYGDNLTIMGYSTICGTECTKQFSRQLLYNETITIYFSESITTPTVAASSVSNITSNSASVSSSVSGNCGVISRGFCYGTSSNPTISGQHTSNGNGTGSFTGTLSGLTPSTTYYVRAYATNAAGTAYGSQTSFTAPAQPAVTTNNVSNITTNTATGGGNVTSQGTAPVTSRGVCWSTSHNPTIANSHTTNGSGTGGFTSNITGLTQGTTYYVRAYATSSAGTAYGNEVCFTTSVLQVPTVITSTVTNTTSTTATCGGNVTSDGGATVTARGVCWSTSQNPTVNENHTTDGNGLGNFTNSISGLIANTTYYVRAYAVNAVGTAYGNEVSFTTALIQPCPNATIVTDYDGNNYSTVLIGTQCWMAENLRTTHYANGVIIPMVNSTYGETTDPYCYEPNNNGSNVSTYGYLYNWHAVMHGESSSNANPSGVQGVCPTGWHVPSDAEWTQLINYVSGQTQYQCNNSGDKIAKALASTTGWISNTTTCAVGNNQSDNNATGFSAIPAGNFTANPQGGAFFPLGYEANLWSTSAINNMAFSWGIGSGGTDMVRSSTYKFNGKSVRCVRSDNISTPTITVTSLNNMGVSVSVCGKVTISGGAEVTARGVCWSTSPNPTVSTNHTIEGSGPGNFTSILTGLSANTTYYIRTYATNSAGTAYSSQISFTTGNSCPNATIVTDYDGNNYNTVQIGSQCWMAENLRTTHYSDGSYISLGDGNSHSVPYRYFPNNDTSNVPTYGYLYNWAAVMHGESSSNANPSGVQGICPTGWHVPSQPEWWKLFNYVRNLIGCQCNNNSDYTAKALASTSGWNSSTTTCAVGNNQSSNNATGFSALPAGRTGNNDFGLCAYFWTTSQHTSPVAYRMRLSYNDAGYNNMYDDKGVGLSVRCLRNEGSGTVSIPTVTTTSIINISITHATFSGYVTEDGNATVTARGVCWSTSQNPTIADSHTSDGSGTGSFTSNITGLSANITYYVRTYATNSAGTAYGEEVSISTVNASNGDYPCPTVTDFDNNTYNTVLIGNQCWMKENLRTTKYADGTSILQGGSGTSSTTAYWYYPNNSHINVFRYGRLYNWKAVMRNDSSSSANPSGVQGICPDGWHVPSDAEWTQFSNYVKNQSQFLCNSISNNIGKALANTTGWNSSTNICAVGNMPDQNNATDFCALPAGDYYGNTDGFGNYALFWSATEYNGNMAYSRRLQYDSAGLLENWSGKALGHSVRCVKN